MSLPALCLRRPVATQVLLAALMILGAVSLRELPLDFMPMIEEPEIDVEVPFPGSHPLEALRDVVLPIEEEIASIPGIKRTFSRAGSGSAGVEVQFEWSDDLAARKMDVREAVERARPRLPSGIGTIRIQSGIGGPDAAGQILQGRISADRDLSESWELLDRRIRRPLERVRGVAGVHLYGVEPQQVRVDLDLDALRRHGILPSRVIEAIEKANLDLDLGTVRGDVVRYGVRSLGRFRDVEVLRGLRLGHGDVRLRDVAAVGIEEPVLSYGRHLDRKFAIGIDVSKEPTANTVETVDRLMDRIAEVERDPELAGIKLLVWVNQGEEIRNSLSGLLSSGMYGGALAALVLFLFLHRARPTLVVSLAIPFSILVTCAAMYLLGYSLNVLTMLGLMFGVGMLVDNAVVVMENIHRLQAQGIPPAQAARRGAAEVSLAVLASTATTVIVWSWLFVSERSEMTLMVGEVAATICLAVTCSLLISLSFIPLAAARSEPGREGRPGFVLRRLIPAYRALLDWTLRHRGATLGSLFLLGASAAIPFSMMEKSPEPRVRERAVPIFYRVYDPAAKEVLEGYVDRVEAWLESRKEDLRYDSLYSWFSENEGSMTQVYLPLERATEAEVARVRALLREDLPVIPGVKLEVGDRMWFRWGDQRSRVPVRLYGDDPEYLEALSAEFERRLRRMVGVVEVFGPSLEGQKEVRIRVDAERARSLGTTPQAVARTIALVFRGQQLRRFPREDTEMELTVALPEDARPGLATLADLPVPASEGTVPLGSVVDLEVTRTMPHIVRENRKTSDWVSVQFEDGVTTETGKERVGEALAGLALPDGYGWDWGRWGEEHEEGMTRMLHGVLLSVLVVLLLMAALFESLTQPLAILITLPLAFFGAFWSLWMSGLAFDILAFIGIIILIGIVVNNGIVMVDHVNALRRAGVPREQALVDGCGDRLRPVLMTAITTFIGLLPLALSSYTVAGAYIDSLAIAVAGGLASSTAFTLVALPVWYTMVEDVGALLPRLLPVRIRRSPAAAP